MLKIYSEENNTLDEILEFAGDAEEPPPLPPNGIPQQWLPAWIRWPVRLFILPFILLDTWAQKTARVLLRPPYQQSGKCLKRGNCCHYILVPEAKGILGKLFYFWNTQFLGFYRRDEKTYASEKRNVYVMGCRYLKKEGSCGRYFLRPAVCRKWPIIEHFGHPRILKGCGFKATLREK